MKDRSHLSTTITSKSDVVQSVTFTTESDLKEAFHYEITVNGKTDSDIIKLSKDTASKMNMNISKYFFERQTKMSGSFNSSEE